MNKVTPEHIKTKLSEQLRKVRDEYGETWKAFADRCGVSERAMMRWASGKHVITTVQLANVAERLGETLDFLLGYEDDADE